MDGIVFVENKNWKTGRSSDVPHGKCHMKKNDRRKATENRYKRARNCGLCVALAVSLAVISPMSAAASDEEVEEARERVEQAEEKAKDLQEAKERFGGYLEELNGQLDGLTAELEALSARQTELQERLEVTARELLEAKETEANQYEAMKKRIQYMYENGDTGVIELVFSAESLSSILNRAEYAMELAEYDRDMLTAYQETRKLVAEKEQELLTDQAELDRVAEETEEKQNEVLASVAETTRKMEACAEELEDAEGELAAYRRELQKKELEAEERMARLAEEKRKQEEEERRKEQQVADGVGTNADPPAGTAQPSEPPESSSGDSDQNSGSADEPSANPPSVEQPPAPPAADNPSEEFDYSAYSDLELLAAMIYREANMEPWEGKVAVGNVVMNRINSGQYPNTMIGVLSQPYQFTPWGKPKYQAALQNGVNAECVRAAEVAMSGSENHIGGLLHFRTIRPGYEGITIGSHVFY